MATLLTHPATLINPPEYRSTHPAPCATCNALWDEEDDLDIRVDMLDGLFYCMENFTGPSCLFLAKQASYRERAAAIVQEKVQEALDELNDLDRELGSDMAADAEDHPVTILDDLNTRMTAFAKGEDSGWRNGAMLHDDEAFTLRRLFDDAIHRDSFSLTWDLGLHELQPLLRLGEYTAGSRARELARLAVASMDFSHVVARTRKGEVA